MWTWFIDKERIIFRCKLREKVLGRLFGGYCSFACSWLKDIDYLDRNNTSKHCRKYPCLFDKLVRVWAQMNTSACEKRSKKELMNQTSEYWFDCRLGNTVTQIWFAREKFAKVRESLVACRLWFSPRARHQMSLVFLFQTLWNH